MMKMSVIDWIAWVLVMIGGLNWGLVGIFNFNLVDWIFGAGAVLSSIVYILVGASAVWMIIMMFVKKDM